MSHYDSIVIGAGFGGLGAAIQLAEGGQRVLLLEALKYAGGCAATFKKGDYQFEAGATLFSGFSEGQLFQKWQQRYQWPIQFQKLNPTICFRSEQLGELNIPPNREALCEEWAQRYPKFRPQFEAFFLLQRRVADALWPLFDDPYRLPPFGKDSIRWHWKRKAQYMQLLSLINKPLITVLKKYKLDTLPPFVEYCNAICQITIQTSVMEAEAPFALSTLDYIFRGTGHIHGGVGELTEAMLQSLRDLGVQVTLSTRVRQVTRSPSGWTVEARGKEYTARSVVANLTPHALETLIKHPVKSLKAKAKAVEKGWGAAMLYLSLTDHPQLPEKAIHIQCVQDSHKPLRSGNHIFCSISARTENKRAPKGLRTATVSTHVHMPSFQGLEDTEKAAAIEEIQSQMRRTLALRAPEVYGYIHTDMTASPRTFERFTRRTHGYVGGTPRNFGWHNYQGIFPKPILPNLWMVGDSVFPGQSTLATAVGGCRTANAVLKKDWRQTTKELPDVHKQAARTPS
ncbi:MAG: NAD(P)/FAD-dependent oxidoreductase [Myxococcota bacterium]|nr:NAD(P)/FAD-dependent oxidoreductase [Myxococcota bacterium]